jgi:hypothetical protein
MMKGDILLHGEANEDEARCPSEVMRIVIDNDDDELKDDEPDTRLRHTQPLMVILVMGVPGNEEHGWIGPAGADSSCSLAEPEAPVAPASSQSPRFQRQKLLSSQSLVEPEPVAPVEPSPRSSQRQ